MCPRPYVVVLAGGDGTRLQPLTQALYGVALPKQFAVLVGDRSLLQMTIVRARQLTSEDRIAVVVARHHEALARTQLADAPGVELIVQPRSLDTGPALLLPMARILARDPDARVVFLPSDHYVADARPLLAACEAASSGRVRELVTLVGVIPTGPEVEYGWIVRGARIGRTRAFAVARFHEKPPHVVAEQLWQAGAMWNTFISTGPVATYWAIASRHLPLHTDMLERYAAAIGSLVEHDLLEAAYATMPAANFSREVLAHADLAVVPVTGSGWSDWGSPQRVFASLAGTDAHARLVERIRGTDLRMVS